MSLIFGEEDFNARLNHKFGFIVFKLLKSNYKKILTNGYKQIVSL